MGVTDFALACGSEPVVDWQWLAQLAPDVSYVSDTR